MLISFIFRDSFHAFPRGEISKQVLHSEGFAFLSLQSLNKFSKCRITSEINLCQNFLLPSNSFYQLLAGKKVGRAQSWLDLGNRARASRLFSRGANVRKRSSSGRKTRARVLFCISCDYWCIVRSSSAPHARCTLQITGKDSCLASISIRPEPTPV